MGLPTQNVKVRLLGRQTDRLGEVVESRVQGLGLEQVQLTAVLERLPQPGVQADRVREQEDSPIGLAFERQPDGSIQKGGGIGDGGKAPSAEKVEVRSENQAQAGYFEGALEPPGAHEDPARYGQTREKNRHRPCSPAPLPCPCLASHGKGRAGFILWRGRHVSTIAQRPAALRLSEAGIAAAGGGPVDSRLSPVETAACPPKTATGRQLLELGTVSMRKLGGTCFATCR